MNRARVSGRGNANIRRDAGSGSNTLVKTVSEPLASNRNGSRSPAMTAPSRISAGTPWAYRAVCHCTPVNGVPAGLASMTPHNRRSTYRR
ncbi:unannotated protein [freshwater metagenome]|uniref:Unannotated protein n=1 Tax=freshwater metagenome TaxID=449393 RepID=A0A6J7LTA9_9ZZZZ